jgi:hypothetical protein
MARCLIIFEDADNGDVDLKLECEPRPAGWNQNKGLTEAQAMGKEFWIGHVLHLAAEAMSENSRFNVDVPGFPTKRRNNGFTVKAVK